MSTRGVISSLAQSSDSRSTPSIMSTSDLRVSSCSTADFITDISSSSESARRSRSNAGAKAREAKQMVERLENQSPELQKSRTARGEFLGVVERHPLRRDLPEDQQENRHHRNRQPAEARNVDPEDMVADGGDCEVDEVVADKERRKEHRLVREARRDQRVLTGAARANPLALGPRQREKHCLR